MRPELIIKLRSDASKPPVDMPRMTAEGGEGAGAALHDLLTEEELVLRPLRPRRAGDTSAPMRGGADPAPSEARLDAFWSVIGDRAQLDTLRARMIAVPGVEAAFVAPPPEVMPLNVVPAPLPTDTPDYRNRQGYLDSAPAGVDAPHAWTYPGGRGDGIRIIDIEGDWHLDHEDLVGQTAARLTLQAAATANWQGAHDVFLQHGTAVLGQLMGMDNGRGITGLASAAEAGVVSHMHVAQGDTISGPATAIAKAADLLRPGDVMLLEMHMPGPRYGFQPMAGQQGYIAVEWWPHIFAAIKDATDKGILVVQAAGNGRENLDASVFDAPATGFEPTWRNPFRRDGAADSGAILVGAGASPIGSGGLDRARLPFSNYGACVDAQGWGETVVTAGYGDLQRDPGERRSYTATFSGTSSAAPIVAGALACVQGILLARGNELLTPKEARTLLRRTGSPQQWPAGKPTGSERIGNRPNLKELIEAALARASA